jgi:hypothetical protein
MGWGRFNEVDAGFRVEVYVAMPLAVVLSALFALQLLSDVRLWRRLLVQIRKQRSSRARADMTSQRGKVCAAHARPRVLGAVCEARAHTPRRAAPRRRFCCTPPVSSALSSSSAAPSTRRPPLASTTTWP